jgi:CPA2 family monovalent cation:H+ antiporter-2
VAGPSSGFVEDVGLALATAAAAHLVARRLGVPSVVAYLAAGLVVGPYLPVPVYVDTSHLHALSEFGVVLVMFAVGLELRLGRLLQVLPSSGFTGLVQMAALWAGGRTLGLALGWTPTEALFLGGCLAISSTMVVSKVLDRHPVPPTVRQHVFGVLVLQDVAAVALITLYTAIASGAELGWGAFGVLLGGLMASLVAMTAAGMLFVPWMVRRVVATRDPELLAVTATALCFGFALLAGRLGYSVALGAFVAGVLVAESGESHTVEHAIRPLKEVFAAVFFVAIGMTVDPWRVVEHAGTVLAVSALVVVAQLVSVTGAGLLSGLGLRRSVTAGLSLGQVGEFAFVIAGIGTASGQVGPQLPAVVVATAVVTAFTTPLLVARADGLLRALDHTLPRPVHDALALHEAGIATLRTGPPGPVRAPVRALLVDAALLAGLLGVAGVAGPEASRRGAELLGIGTGTASGLVLATVVIVATPIVAVLVRHAGRVADAILARVAQGAALAAVAREALRAALLLMLWLGMGLPLLAVVGPSAGPLGHAVLASVAAGLGLSLWRALRGRDEDVRSVTARVVAVIGRSAAPDVAPPPSRDVDAWLPPVEAVARVALPVGSAAAGRTLAELDLRARTGATVVALVDADGATISLPHGRTRLAPGSALMLLGSADEVAAARAMLDVVSGGCSATPA